MKRLFIGVVAVTTGLVAGALMLLAVPSPNPKAIEHGVTFSAPYAASLGLEWQQAYTAILDELGVKQLRLMAYWNEIEPIQGQYDFRGLDYQMDQAAARDARVILAIGRKLPRWPECHIPAWAQELHEMEQQEQILTMLAAVVDRYRAHPALAMWQVENEPLFDFGVCPPEDRNFLQREVDVVRRIDGGHQVLITDSGELNSWLPAAAYGDVVGTTMYRTVFSSRTQKPFSYDYIFPAWAYRAKARLVSLVRGKSVLVAELQAEPWGSKLIPDLTPEERAQSFSVSRFQELDFFAGRTQLSPVFWWGVEYWYWEKTMGNGAFWNYAEKLFERPKSVNAI